MAKVFGHRCRHLMTRIIIVTKEGARRGIVRPKVATFSSSLDYLISMGRKERDENKPQEAAGRKVCGLILREWNAQSEEGGI